MEAVLQNLVNPSSDASLLIVDDVLGLLVVSLLVLQAILGYYHHYRYVKDRPSERRWFTYAHITGGLILTFIGILNGGSGLTMARVSTKFVTLWWVLCAVVPVIYGLLCVIKIIIMRRRSVNR